MKVFWAVIAMISIGVGVYIAMDMNTKQQEVVKRVTTDGGPVLTITEPDTGITADDNTDERVASVAKRLPQGQAFIDLVNSLGSAVVTVVAIDESGIERASGTGFILSHNEIGRAHV